jgi:hypothetical protein
MENVEEVDLSVAVKEYIGVDLLYGTGICSCAFPGRQEARVHSIARAAIHGKG